MDELKQSFERLGLPETATREEVEKRYDTLLRRARAKERSGEGKDESFDEITKAYRYILTYEDRKAAEAFNQKAYGKYKGMARSAEKLDHFWRYYKFHVLGGIVVLALIIYGISAFHNHQEEKARLAKLPPVDVSIMMLGGYYMNDFSNETGPLEQSLLSKFPDWKRFKVLLNYLPLDASNETDMAAQQKAVVVLATERPDIYIMDKKAFDWMGPQDAFLPLDDLASGQWKPYLDAGSGTAVKMATKDNPDEHVYGIDISGTKLAQGLPIVTKTQPVELIAAIRSNSKNIEKSEQFIEQFLKSGK
ncbi:J domain-containing protein [Paenibacillus protaetiae]|uniref:J domain-containing protein n=1 Tax=Paenibacillus protaetiae TaxID=2509456 RepID=A0A4P6ERL7_9BACL|nr:J domain-containing protein [Paenibacillus protaetiae]QAY65524.1 J domain-containing protein [Paenibacillus protaetiae]